MLSAPRKGQRLRSLADQVAACRAGAASLSATPANHQEVNEKIIELSEPLPLGRITGRTSCQQRRRLRLSFENESRAAKDCRRGRCSTSNRRPDEVIFSCRPVSQIFPTHPSTLSAHQTPRQRSIVHSSFTILLRWPPAYCHISHLVTRAAPPLTSFLSSCNLTVCSIFELVSYQIEPP